jgi:hypothetical protein
MGVSDGLLARKPRGELSDSKLAVRTPAARLAWVFDNLFEGWLERSFLERESV